MGKIKKKLDSIKKGWDELIFAIIDHALTLYIYTVKPVYNGHPRDWTKLAVIHRWPLYTGDCLNPQKVST